MKIMVREWTAWDLEWLVKIAEEEERWRTFVLFTY